jgi:hypothetical protein
MASTHNPESLVEPAATPARSSAGGSSPSPAAARDRQADGLLQQMQTEQGPAGEARRQLSNEIAGVATEAARTMVNEVLGWRVIFQDRPLNTT